MPLESTVPTNIAVSPQSLDVLPVNTPIESIAAVQVEEVQPLFAFELVTVAVPDHEELMNGLAVVVEVEVGVGVEVGVEVEVEVEVGVEVEVEVEVGVEVGLPLAVPE